MRIEIQITYTDIVMDIGNVVVHAGGYYKDTETERAHTFQDDTARQGRGCSRRALC